MENGPINYIVEADIKGFFDAVDQDRLMDFLAHRIADTRMLRYIKRFLKAGISICITASMYGLHADL